MTKNSSSKHQKLFLSQIPSVFRTSFLNLSNVEVGMFDPYIYLTQILPFFQIFFMNMQLIRRHIPTDASYISGLFTTLEDFVTFDNNFTYSEPNKASFLFNCALALYFINLFACFVVVIYLASRREIGWLFIPKFWSLIIRLHFSVFFLPISNYFFRIISDFHNENFKIIENSSLNQVIFYISILGCIINISFAILPKIFLFNALPAQSTLSSKGSLFDLFGFYQMLFLSLIGRLVPELPYKPWLIVSISFALSLIRQFLFLYSLPRYHFQAMRLDLYLIRFSSCSTAVSLAVLLVNQIPDFQIPSSGFIMIQLIVAFSYSILSDLHFHEMLGNLLFAKTEDLNPYRALHKVLILKYVRKKMKIFNPYSKKIDLSYLFFKATSVSIEKIFGDKSGLEKKNFNEKWVRSQLKRKFYEKLVSDFSSVSILKLVLARHYTRNVNLYILAIKTLTQIKSSSFTVKASKDLLHLQIGEQVLNNSQKLDSGLQIYEYITAKAEQDKISQGILKQLNIQRKFWAEYNLNNPDIWKLQTLSGKVLQQKKKIEKQWMCLEHKLNKSLYLFYLVYGHYQIVMNHSFIKGEEYLQKYYLFSERYKKRSDPKCSLSPNIYDSNSFALTIRTGMENLGKIINCSNSIKKLLGYEKSFIVGSNIKVLMSPFFALRHNDYLQDYVRTGVSKFLDHLQTVFVKKNSGFVQKVSLLASIHPFVHQEVCLTGLFRIIEEPIEYVFLTSNGDIDSSTERIGSKLGLKNKKLNIHEICPDFGKINKALNSYSSKKFEKLPSTAQLYHTEFKETLKDGQENTEQNLNTLVESVYSQRPLLLSPKSNIKVIKNPLRDIQKEKEEEIAHDNFPKVGQKLDFITLPNSSIMQSKIFAYNCKVKVEHYRDSYLKIIEIDVDNKEEDFNELDNDIFGDKFKNFKANFDGEKNVSEEASSFNFHNIDEKVKTGGGIVLENLGIKQNIESRLSPQNLSLGYNSNKKNATPIKQTVDKKKNPSYKLFEKFSHLKILKKTKILNESLSNSSTSDSQKRKQTYVDQSLDTKYYPGLVYFFLIFFFGAAFTILISQVGLPWVIRISLRNIKDMKTTLDLANSANDAFTFIDLEIKGVFAAESGLIAFDLINSSIKEALNNDIVNIIHVLI